jgi:hypothetical protein
MVACVVPFHRALTFEVIDDPAPGSERAAL